MRLSACQSPAEATHGWTADIPCRLRRRGCCSMLLWRGHSRTAASSCHWRCCNSTQHRAGCSCPPCSCPWGVHGSSSSTCRQGMPSSSRRTTRSTRWGKGLGGWQGVIHHQAAVAGRPMTQCPSEPQQPAPHRATHRGHGKWGVCRLIALPAVWVRPALRLWLGPSCLPINSSARQEPATSKGVVSAMQPAGRAPKLICTTALTAGRGSCRSTLSCMRQQGGWVVADLQCSSRMVGRLSRALAAGRRRPCLPLTGTRVWARPCLSATARQQRCLVRPGRQGLWPGL